MSLPDVNKIDFSHMLQRARGSLGLAAGQRVQIFNFLEVFLGEENGRQVTLQFVSGDYLDPRPLPGGKRTMKAFTEAAFVVDGVARSAGYAFCGEKDEFDLTTGEKLALRRLLDLINPPYKGKDVEKRREVWRRYQEARDEQDEVLFQTVLRHAKEAEAQVQQEQQAKKLIQMLIEDVNQSLSQGNANVIGRTAQLSGHQARTTGYAAPQVSTTEHRQTTIAPPDYSRGYRPTPGASEADLNSAVARFILGR